VGTIFAEINVSPNNLPLLQLYSYENRCKYYYEFTDAMLLGSSNYSPVKKRAMPR
jgi:hypothetical protein